MNTAPAPAFPSPVLLRDGFELDLARARNRLLVARAHQRVKDSTGNRVRVAQCQEQIDVLLDAYLAARRGRWSPTACAGPALAVG